MKTSLLGAIFNPNAKEFLERIIQDNKRSYEEKMNKESIKVNELIEVLKKTRQDSLIVIEVCGKSYELKTVDTFYGENKVILVAEKEC